MWLLDEVRASKIETAYLIKHINKKQLSTIACIDELKRTSERYFLSVIHGRQALIYANI